MFFMGPLAASYCMERDFSPANPLNIQHPRTSGNRMLKFSASSDSTPITSATSFTTARSPRNSERTQKVCSFNAGLPGVPSVMDMSIGRTPVLDPEKEERLAQQNPDWHVYIPFCPEHPEVRIL